MTLIGKIRVRIDGQEYPAVVTGDGTAVLPSGEEKKLTEEQFAEIKEKLEQMKAAMAESKSLTEPSEEKPEEKKDPPAEPETKKEPEPAPAPAAKEEPKPAAEPEKDPAGGEEAKKAEKKPKYFVVAVVLGVLLILESAAVGVGFGIGYLSLNAPSHSANIMYSPESPADSSSASSSYAF